MNNRIVLGLSDGVDSAYSAFLLKQQGYDIIGLYLFLGDEKALEGAEKNARETGIPLTVIDAREELEEYICKPFISEYLAGRTPIPCIGCNPKLKFKALMDEADRIGADHIATGHYVRCDGHALYMGKPDCDQSYMLARLNEHQVRKLILPLGEYEKKTVRKLAAEAGLSCADKPDSRENCFIKGEGYADWIAGRTAVPGVGPVYYNGIEIARHEGIHRYTVGQRWPEMQGERRVYISSIDAVNNAITLCLWEDLFSTTLTIGQVHWINQSFTEPFRASVRARHTRWETPECTVYPSKNGTAFIKTDTALRAPAPGQAAALYIGCRLIGGGYIC